MRRPSKAAIAVLALLAAIYVGSFASPPMPPIHGDGHYTYLWARSLVFDGDLDLANDYQVCGDPWALAAPVAPGLWPRNQWTIGPVLGWAPLLALGRIASDADDSADPMIANGCRGELGDWAMFGSVLMGFAAVVLAWRMARRHVGEAAAVLGAGAVALASPLPYYAFYLPSYSHAAAAFGAALFLERWDATRGRRDARRWAMLGALLGLAMLMRPQLAVLALAPLVEWVGQARDRFAARDRRAVVRLVVAGLVFVALTVVVLAPQLVVWKKTYGAYLAMPQGPHYMRWSEPRLDGVLWGSTGGLFVWTPVLYFAFAGFVIGLLRRRLRPATLGLALVLAATTYVNASVWDWWGAVGFSNRRFTEMALPFAFGIAIVTERVLAWAEQRPRRFAIATVSVVVALFAVWNHGAMWGIAKARVLSHREGSPEIAWTRVFAEIAHGVYDRVGNPLSWPASIPFAIAYDTHPARYDAMRGLGVFFANYEDREPRELESDIELGTDPWHLEYLIDGFDLVPRDVGDRRAVVTTERHARMLVPFFIEDVGAIEITWRVAPPGTGDGATMAAIHLGGEPEGAKPDERRGRERPRSRADRPRSRVALVWNDAPVAHLSIDDRWTTTRVAIRPGVVESGINELCWEIEGPPIAIHEIVVKR